jgi:tetratricopeptide (TPR) repeat protein
MARIWYVAVSLLFIFSISIGAWAKPIRIQSDNFTFIGDVREKDGQELIIELEQYRNAILQLLGLTPNLEPIRVRIYAAKSTKELQLLTGMQGIGGVYRTTMDGPIFILNAKKGFSRGNQARHIALHEYTHHLLAAYADDFYPRWYNEGFANYLSTFEVNKDGGLVIGRPYNPYAYALSGPYWMPTGVLVNSIRHYPFKAGTKPPKGISDQDRFYAQSWLAVHYLQMTKTEVSKTRKYIDFLNGENRPKDMFTQAFGYTPEDFHKKLKAYYKKNRFNVATVQPTFDINTNPLETQLLKKNEIEFHRAESMRIFSGLGVTIDENLKQYDKAAEKLGSNAHIFAGKAELFARNKEWTQAISLIDQALALDSEDGKINMIAGNIYVHKNREADVPDAAEIKKARIYLKKALIKDGDNLNAHFNYAQSFQVLRDTPNKQAVASAKTSLIYYRSVEFVESNLSMAAVLLAANEDEYAEPTIDKAIVWARGGAKMAARSMREYMEE